MIIKTPKEALNDAKTTNLFSKEPSKKLSELVNVIFERNLSIENNSVYSSISTSDIRSLTFKSADNADDLVSINLNDIVVEFVKSIYWFSEKFNHFGWKTILIIPNNDFYYADRLNSSFGYEKEGPINLKDIKKVKLFVYSDISD